MHKKRHKWEKQDALCENKEYMMADDYNKLLEKARYYCSKQEKCVYDIRKKL